MFGQFGQKQYYNVGGPGGPPNRGGGGGGGMNNQMPFDEQEKAARSVFVGNIPYEATEEQLKAIFTEIGVVMSFRLVYDRETGKPKGYGFCEYQDTETALSAMRNLNGRELHGRNLRVDHATRDHGDVPKGEKDTQQSATQSGNVPQGGVNLATATQSESIYGQSIADPADVPKKISESIRTLPAEQMYALMKEMKEVIMNNPDEARSMLLQNPQLAYALLQATTIARIITPGEAVKMLHPVREIQPAPLETQPPPPTPQPKLTPVKVAPAPPVPKIEPSRHHQTQQHHHQSRAPPPQRVPPQRGSREPFGQGQRDPRGSTHRQPPSHDQPRSSSSSAKPSNGESKPQDMEKMALIQQVLQLTPDQINMLPEDQKRSILSFKEQLKSQGRS